MDQQPRSLCPVCGGGLTPGGSCERCAQRSVFRLVRRERRQIAASSLPEVMKHRRVETVSFNDRVRRRAYDIYTQRRVGRRPAGSDLDDWLQAKLDIQSEDSGEHGFPMS
jgi:hypothetical protein